MGEEYGERRPFQFFTDHVDPRIVEATREGRRREFGFAGDDVPDPQAGDLPRQQALARGAPGLRELYADLLRLRRGLARDASALGDDATRIVRVRRGEVELVADFRNRTVEIRR